MAGRGREKQNRQVSHSEDFPIIYVDKPPPHFLNVGCA